MFKFTHKQLVNLTEDATNQIYAEMGKVVTGPGNIMAIRLHPLFGALYTVNFNNHMVVINEDGLEQAKPQGDTEPEKTADQFNRVSVDYLGGCLNAYKAAADMALDDLKDAIVGVTVNLNKAIAKRDAEKVQAKEDDETAKNLVAGIFSAIDPGLGAAFKEFVKGM